jgi:hypothetical protein
MKPRQLAFVVLATAALAGTLWYLLPAFPSLIPNLVAALAVLAAPMYRWLPRERYGRITATWLIGGLLGAYIFGTLVLGAGVLAGLGIAARRCWTRRLTPRRVKIGPWSSTVRS